MLLLGCVKIDEMINRVDGQTINGVHFEFVSKQGIQAKFKHDAPNNEVAIQAIKMFFRKDEYLSKYITSALEA